VARGRPGRGAGRRVPEEGRPRGEAEAAMGRFWGRAAAAVPRSPQGHLLGGKWAKWLACRGPLVLQGAPNGPKNGSLGTPRDYVHTRSRQDKSKEVGGVGSKRTSSGGNGGHHVWWWGGGLIFRLLRANHIGEKHLVHHRQGQGSEHRSYQRRSPVSLSLSLFCVLISFSLVQQAIKNTSAPVSPNKKLQPGQKRAACHVGRTWQNHGQRKAPEGAVSF
jgi:hypothetical protein